jgi:diaminopimelate decarboxylase
MRKDSTISLLQKNKIKWAKEAPCFVVDTKKLENMIKELKKNLPGEIAYSFKTNPDLQIAKKICGNGCSFLVSSPDELEKLSKIKSVNKKNLIFQSPSLTKEQLLRLLRLGVKRFSIDSWDQLKLILHNVPFHEDSFELFVRVNTGVKVKNPELPYGMDSFLGFPLDEAKNVLKNIDKFWKNGNVKLGIHNHLISQNTYLDAWRENVKAITNFLQEIKDEGVNIDYVNFGGGYPVAYGSKKVPSLGQIGKILADGRKNMSKIYPDMKYIYEPGRKTVGESIVLVGQVAHIKKFREQDIAILNCSLYNCALDTLIVDLYLPVCKIGKGECKKTNSYVLRGSTPDSLDVFARNVKLPELKNGDYLAFLQAGAYSFGSEFISLPRVKTILI